MPRTTPTLFDQISTLIFGETAPLNNEEKQQIIEDIPNSESSTEINKRNKKVGIAFNIMQSAIAGVIFQYYQNYVDDGNNLSDDFNSLREDFRGHSSHIINHHTNMVFGVAICSVTSIALALIHRQILKQNPKSHNISNSIKHQINELNTKELIKGIDDLNNDSPDALNIKIPKGTDPLTKRSISYLLGGAIISLSSISEDQQYLVYAASVTMAKFAIEQYDKRIGVEINAQSCLGNILENEESQKQKVKDSITGKKVAKDFSEPEMEELRSKIKQQMQLSLADKSDVKTDVVKLFTLAAQTFAFFGSVHNKPGSLFIPNDLAASAIDFTIGSIAFNLIGQLQTNFTDLTKNDQKVIPLGEFTDLESPIEPTSSDDIQEQTQKPSPRIRALSEDSLELPSNLAESTMPPRSNSR